VNQNLLSVYGLKFHPFRPDVPVEALHATPAIDGFCKRVGVGPGLQEEKTAISRT